MRVMVTGAAGFIGMHAALRLAGAGREVAGIDNFNAYYDPALKRARAAELARAGVAVKDLQLRDEDAVRDAFLAFGPDVVLHLAAQPGVRYSLTNPMAYVDSNLVGHTSVLEACRALGGRLSHMVYASSSTVYAGSARIPFREGDPLPEPVSFYAATKQAGETLASAYAHLYGLRQVGLRFFTVYGPWGRPDMAYWAWTEAMLKGQPIRVFNHGDMRRDFTYVDDVISAVTATVEGAPRFEGDRPHRLYNIGNHRPESLDHVIDVLERALGRRAVRRLEPMQPGDVKETFADIAEIRRDYGFRPATTIEEGLPRFVAWYRAWSGA